MKPERGPKTMFFGNYCNGIPGKETQEAPKRDPGGTQRHPEASRGTQEAPRRIRG